ncbi:CAP domain-containing protein [Streptomyces sp. NPDC001093]|uniref:CAP domain-containing protein n=1 Tax=Streptomyces sp. NPDC001093 TaxID=3154376 RepID=UPI0033255A7A
MVPGGNVPLPGGVVLLRVAGPFDVSALVTGADGKAGSDADFVFYNQPRAAGVRLRGDTLAVEPALLRGGATRVTVVVSAAEPGTPLGRLPGPRLEVTDGSGRTVARFVPPRPGPETVLLLAEVYLRPGTGWKLRAIGQGYADGLAGLARDFGVQVTDDGGHTAPHRPHGRTATPSPRSAPAVHSARPTAAAPPVPPTDPGSPSSRPTTANPHPPSSRPTAAPGVAADGFLQLVNSARTQAGSPCVAVDPRLLSAARAHARAMAEAGRLGSEGRDGVSVYQRIGAAGYAYVSVGEHLVSGPRSPAEFVEYLLGSASSRRTLLDPAFRHAALAHAGAGHRYWTALWAAPLTPDALSRTAAEVVALTNTERGRAGLPPLAADPQLTAAARAHCADMVTRDFYDHIAPDGSRPWDRAAAAGYRGRTIGENIACGQRSPAEVVDGWMNSPGHRANILKRDFGHIGIGFAGGGRAGTYWAQLFGG